KVYFAL
ncbi:unnamed protein product, partial [Parnassius apollo]